MIAKPQTYFGFPLLLVISTTYENHAGLSY